MFLFGANSVIRSRFVVLRASMVFQESQDLQVSQVSQESCREWGRKVRKGLRDSRDYQDLGESLDLQADQDQEVKTEKKEIL